MQVIVFDTETTGLPSPKLELSKQPYVCQFAAYVIDLNLEAKTYTEVKKISQFIKPAVSIPMECTRIHGISNEDVSDKPTFPQIADKLFQLFEKSDVAVAHNLNFDKTILENEFLRIGRSKNFLPTQTYCTMEKMKPILKLPGRGMGYKSPNMQELHKHFFGEGFKDAHNALYDVLALSKCLKAMFEQGIFNPEPVDQTKLF